MYILFSPSEGKKIGGDSLPLNKGELLFPELYEQRLPLIQSYNDLILDGSTDTLQKLTGIKKEEEIKKYQNDIFSTATMPAIERYDGVAYDYLDIHALNEKEKTYLHEQTIVFSNLFGPIKGGDLIPTYKFKQGATLDKVATEKIYKKEFTNALHELFKDELILDLRAGFYEKFYALDQDLPTISF